MLKPITAMLFALVSSHAFADDYVRGHIKRDGTYVAPHMRSNADPTPLNNYSTRGNYNPYTGQKGYVDPYAKPNEGIRSPYGNGVNSMPGSGNQGAAPKGYAPRYN